MVSESLAPPTEHTTSPFDVWLLRLLLATLLIFGSEILLWTTALQRTATDWLVIVPGYIVLSVLVLDLATRYRIRDLYDVMTIMVVYATIAGLLFHPELLLADFPRTFVTRGIGGHGLLGLEMFGLFLALTGGQSWRPRLLIGFSIWLGFYWGIWVRWTPLLTDVIPDEVSLGTMFVGAGIVLGLALSLFVIVTRRRALLVPADLRLSQRGLSLVLVALGALSLLRLVDGSLSLGVIIAGLILTGLAIVVLWFRRVQTGKTLLDDHVPATPPAWRWVIVPGMIFFLTTALAYSLPLIDVAGYNQLSLMEFGFALIGFGWLPVIAAVISTRAIDYSSRTRQM